MKAGDIAIKGKSLKTGEEGWIKLEDIARAIFEAIAEQNNQCPNKSEGDVKLLTKQVQTGSDNPNKSHSETPNKKQNYSDVIELIDSGKVECMIKDKEWWINFKQLKTALKDKEGVLK